jgi:hypothetical protein
MYLDEILYRSADSVVGDGTNCSAVDRVRKETVIASFWFEERH